MFETETSSSYFPPVILLSKGISSSLMSNIQQCSPAHLTPTLKQLARLCLEIQTCDSLPAILLYSWSHHIPHRSLNSSFQLLFLAITHLNEHLDMNF